MGNDARALLPVSAKKVWTVSAASHFDAMTKYYAYMGWGTYTTQHPSDYEPYRLNGFEFSGMIAANPPLTFRACVSCRSRNRFH